MNDNANAPTRGRTLWWPAAFLGVVAVWLGAFAGHPDWLTAIGVGHYRVEVQPRQYQELWFIDTFAVLAANDAVAAGKDPYAPNPLDVFDRPHVYGPDWLYLHHLGLSRRHVIPVGLGLVALFVVIATLVLRPASASELIWCAGVFCSVPVLASLERANNDLVVFLLLTLVVTFLLRRSKVLRWSAVLLIAVAAGLKYYPAVAAALLIGAGPLSERRPRLIAMVFTLTLVTWHVLTRLPRSARVPAPAGLLTMGAVIPFREFGLDGAVPQLAIVAIGALLFLLAWRFPLLRDWTPPADQTRAWYYFILGALVLTGCFFVGQHYAYRWAFGIWLAPFLFRAATGNRPSHGVRRLAQLTSVLLLLVLWAEGIFVFSTRSWPHDQMMKAAQVMHWCMQPVFWTFILCLMIFLAKFVRDGLTSLAPNHLQQRPA